MTKLNRMACGLFALASMASGLVAQPAVVARTGDPAPGFESGAVVVGFDAPVWDATGHVYVAALVEPSPGALPESAVYAIEAGDLRLVFRVSPSAPGDVLAIQAIAAIPEGIGVVASVANDPAGSPTHEHTHGLIVNGAFTTYPDSADIGAGESVSVRPFATDGSRLWTVKNGESIRNNGGVLAARGDVAPGTAERQFYEFSAPAAGSNGSSAFRAVVGADPSAEPIERTAREGVWRVQAGQIDAVLLDNEGLRSLGSPSINSHADVALRATVVETASTADVVLLERDGSLSEIGGTGDVTSVGTLARILGTVHVTDARDVLAHATLDGAPASANTGIFAFRVFAPPRAVLVEGDQIPGDGVGRAGMLRVRTIVGWRSDEAGAVSALVDLEDAQSGEGLGTGLLLADRSGSRRLVAWSGQSVGGVTVRAPLLPSPGARSRETLVAARDRVPVLVELQAPGQAIIEVDRPCVADVGGSAGGNPDGQVSIADFMAYMNLWLAGDARADVTTTGDALARPDGVVDLSDFSYYLTLWAAGCP